LVGEFHSSAIWKRFNPLVAHSAPPSGDSVEIIRALKLKLYKFSSHRPWHAVDEIRHLAHVLGNFQNSPPPISDLTTLGFGIVC
jgi:hypothetical protein